VTDFFIQETIWLPGYKMYYNEFDRNVYN